MDHGTPSLDTPSPIDAHGLFRAIVDSTDDAVASVDLQGTVTSWNAAAERLYGFGARELLGQPIDPIYPDPEDLRHLTSVVVAGRPVLRAEVVRRHKSGDDVVVEESISPVRDAHGDVVGIAVLTRDATERRRMQDELALAHAALEANLARLQRSNAELEQFAYVASHDLSEPLRAVAGMVQLLQRRYRGKLDADADEFIEFAIDGCGRMRAMIDDILAYSRVSRAELELDDIALDDLVAGVVGTLREQVDDTGAVVIWQDLPVIRADRGQLAQVLQNLLSNAIKFRGDRAPRIEINGERTAAGWRISVADDGIGIEPQYRQRIFRMFQRLHRRDEIPGTGIGLAIVERIVDRHGGSVSVDANPGGGSVFTIALPEHPEVPR